MLICGRLVVLLSFATSLALIVGCAAPQPQTAPIAATTPPPAAQPATPFGPDAPSSLTFFGDRPDHERVPFESRLVTNIRQHSFTTEGFDFDPDVLASDGLLVYASTRNSIHPDIFVKRIEGATLTQLTGDPADDIQPRFSPDGQQVVFCSNRAGSWDLWRINRDGSGLAQLTSDATDEVAPCWSPDGSQLAYTVWGHRSHQWEIWILSTAQPSTRRFLAYGMFPAWSPDGGQIAYQRSRERGGRLFSIWTITYADGEARYPTEVAHSDTHACIAPSWSPDGEMIAYCAVREQTETAPAATPSPEQADLWVVEVASGVRMKLTDGSEPAFNPVWSPGGRIFFVCARGGSENIWSLRGETQAYAMTAGEAERDTVAQDTRLRAGAMATGTILED
jgi:TolB protein